MARLLGVDIPGGKKIGISLRYIYGIGPSNALVILEKAGIDPNIRTEKLSDEQLEALVVDRWNSRVKYELVTFTTLGINFMRACSPPRLR